MADERIELFKGAFVEEEFDAFACGELTVAMLAIDTVGTAAEPGIGATSFEFCCRMNIRHYAPV